ncbi:MAG: response regulator [Clostridia bacterium]|nr:response regulator [Clostridia bacterium]
MAAAILLTLLCRAVLPINCALAESAAVRVGYYENEVFQEGARPDAVRTGYAYEYYQKLSEYTGWKYEYVYGEYGDLYEQLLRGEIDLLAGLAWREERAGLIGYPELAMGHETYSLVKHSTDADITASPESLAGRRIGVLDSAMVSVLNSYLTGHGVQAEVAAYRDYEALFAAFDAHEIDVLAAEGDGAHGRADAEVLTAFGASDYYLCVSAKRKDLLADLNAAQTQLAVEEPNYLNALRARYYPVSISSMAFSAAEREWMAGHTGLTVGYLNHYLPYSDTDKDGQVTGLVRDILLRMLENLSIAGMSLSWRGFDSYDEMIRELNAGGIDLAFPVGGGLYYSEINGICQSSPVVSSSTELVYKGEYSEALTRHFAVNQNNRMQYYFIRTHYPEAEITLFPSIEDCLRAVLSGQAGCTTLNGLRANDILKNNAFTGLNRLQLNHDDNRCFGVPIGQEGLLKLINRGIIVIGEDYAPGLAYRYAEQLYTVSLADVIRNNWGLFAGILLAVAALIIGFLVRDSRRHKRQAAEKEKARQALEEKNSQLAESQQALSDALKAAEQASRAKTAFLNNMSHDIRTPMNAIVGFTALAASHTDKPDLVKDYLEKITLSSRHLLSLINDVLDMSRIESGKVVIEEAPVHLPDLFRDIRSIIQVNTAERHQQLLVDTEGVVSEDVMTDRLRLNQVLLNILSNAVKFTPEGGAISLRVIEKHCDHPGYAEFEFRVKDNGIGMSEEFQKTIFDAFTREKTSTVSGIQGTGLGMAITKNIVDMMGGTISLTSAEGKGTEFVVRLRCRVCDDVRPAEALPEMQGKRALVVDDDINSCLSVCDMLSGLGLKPVWTQDGREAARLAREAIGQGEPFDYCLVDWLMPELSGIETVRELRQVIGANPPIIMLTAYDWSDIQEEALEAGATSFCAKPLFLSGLREALTQPAIRQPAETQTAPENPDFSGRRVLLAEDNEMNQLIAQTILEGVGFAVDIANDGSEAVDRMREAPAGTYDVVLMDIQMPYMDGYEAARQIRALPDREKAEVPIVAVTANAFEEDRQMAREAGMNGHLAKPYDIPRMMALLSGILGQGRS